MQHGLSGETLLACFTGKPKIQTLIEGKYFSALVLTDDQKIQGGSPILNVIQIGTTQNWIAIRTYSDIYLLCTHETLLIKDNGDLVQACRVEKGTLLKAWETGVVHVVRSATMYMSPIPEPVYRVGLAPNTASALGIAGSVTDTCILIAYDDFVHMTTPQTIKDYIVEKLEAMPIPEHKESDIKVTLHPTIPGRIEAKIQIVIACEQDPDHEH